MTGYYLLLVIHQCPPENRCSLLFGGSGLDGVSRLFMKLHMSDLSIHVDQFLFLPISHEWREEKLCPLPGSRPRWSVHSNQLRHIRNHTATLSSINNSHDSTPSTLPSVLGGDMLPLPPPICSFFSLFTVLPGIIATHLAIHFLKHYTSLCFLV